ncbi:hypothetical protein [Kocuria salsicia]|uniref:YtxH domain-containing protein n=1 Tax=Kocuria salsicia TaxID=664639 RepID=A0ABV3K9P3_9MICC
MIKRLAFVAGFGIGFVVGSASGRKSYESLRESALNTWNDPKVQSKVSEGTDWVKSEVPVVGEKLAESAQKAAETVGAKASDGAATVKDKAAQGSQTAQQKAQEVKDKAQEKSSKDSETELPKPATTEDEVDMKPAHPAPDAKDMKN